LKLRNWVFTAIIYAILSLVLTGCSNSYKTSADSAINFVVWDGYIYKISDEYVENVSEEIGEVTKYSDIEGTYSGNFSNTYEKGTKYYSIKGIGTEKAIAIEEKGGKYRKAIRDGKYGEK
jgi:hypothetical protein